MSIEKEKDTKHYVNNDDFLEAIIQYKAKLKETREAKGVEVLELSDRPVMSDYLGKCFHQIAENYSHRPNFKGYAFRDEMVGDAVYYMIKYIDTFNPEKTKNPFAYFTSTAHNAFLQRIQKEHKNLYIKFKALENAETFGQMAEEHEYAEQKYNVSGGTSGEDAVYSESAKEKRNEFVSNFEDKEFKKQQKKEQAKLDKENVKD